MSIAVVIPCFQQWGHLHRCLASVIWQLEAGDRVVVVGEGDDALTGAALGWLGGKLSRVELVTGQMGERWGISKARNEGVKLTDCEWIKFLDADDMLAPFALQTFRATPIPDEIRVVSGGMYQVVDGSLQPQILHSNWLDIGRRNPSLVSAGFIRRSAFDAIGGFDEQIGFEEDWDLWLKLCQREFKVFGRVTWPVCYYWINTQERAAKVRDHSVPWANERIDVREYFRRRYGVNPA